MYKVLLADDIEPFRRKIKRFPAGRRTVMPLKLFMKLPMDWRHWKC